MHSRPEEIDFTQPFGFWMFWNLCKGHKLGHTFVKRRWILCSFQHECNLINRSPLGQHLLCRASIRTCTFLQKNEICLKLKMKFTFFRITFDHLVLCFEAGSGKESYNNNNFREGDGTVLDQRLRMRMWGRRTVEKHLVMVSTARVSW